MTQDTQSRTGLRSFGPSTPHDTLSGVQIQFRDLTDDEVTQAKGPVTEQGAEFVAHVDSDAVPLVYRSIDEVAAAAREVYKRITRQAGDTIAVSMIILLYEGKHFAVRWGFKDIGSLVEEAIRDVAMDYLARKQAGEFDQADEPLNQFEMEDTEQVM